MLRCASGARSPADYFWNICYSARSVQHVSSHVFNFIAPRIPPIRPRELVGLCIGLLVFWLLGYTFPSKLGQLRSLGRVCLEALQWYDRLEASNYDPTLVSSFIGEGQVEPTMAKVGPKMVPRGPPELSCPIYPLCGGPLWAHLGPILGYLGPVLGGLGGHLEAKLGLGRLDLGVQGGQKLRC